MASFVDMQALRPAIDTYIYYVSEEATNYPAVEVVHPSSLINGGTFSYSYPNEPKKWLQWCLNDHDACNQWTKPGFVSFLPERLIDVGSVTEPLAPRLIITGEVQDDKRYIALSHRWPSPQVLSQLDIQTTYCSLSEKRKKIEVKKLSKTFKFALGACRWLGVRYLWIDSLCIIQVGTVASRNYLNYNTNSLKGL